MSSLRTKAISGFKWTTFRTVATALIAPISQIIKARSLTMSEYGYGTIVLIIIGLFFVIGQMGISQSIIQNKNYNNKVFASIFIFNTVMSVVGALLLVLLAPFISQVYNYPELRYHVYIISVLVIAQCPSLIFKASLERELYIKELALLDIVRELTTFGILAALLFYKYGVYAITLSSVFGAIVYTVLTVYTFFYFRAVRFEGFESWRVMKEYLHFGIIVSVKQIFSYLTLRVDELAIAYLFQPEALGAYSFAKSMVEKVSSIITSCFSSVVLPLFSRLQDDELMLKKTYNSIAEYIATVCFPVFVGIAVTSDLAIPMIFGEKWSSSLVYFQVLSIAIIPTLLTNSFSTLLLYSRGKPSVVLRNEFVSSCLYFVILFATSKLQVYGILISYVVYLVVRSTSLIFVVNREINQSFLQYAVKLKAPFINTVIMTLALLILRLMMDTQNPILVLTTLVVIGAMTYILCTLQTQKHLIHSLFINE